MLLIDLDPQACLTFSLGIDPDTVETSIHEVLQGAPIADAVLSCDEGVDLVPSTIDLAGAEAMLMPRPGREYVLRTALKVARTTKPAQRHTTSSSSTAHPASASSPSTR